MFKKQKFIENSTSNKNCYTNSTTTLYRGRYLIEIFFLQNAVVVGKKKSMKIIFIPTNNFFNSENPDPLVGELH